MQTLVSYRNIWNIAYPIILILAAENIMNLTDTVFLGRVGEVELGASAIGGIFYLILFIIGLGFSLGTQILISHRNGEKRYAEIGPLLTLSLAGLLVLSLLIMLLVYLLFPWLMGMILSSQAVLKAAVEYMNVRIWGLMFIFVSLTIRAFLTGIYKTSYLTYSALIVAGVNVVLAWLLIFGNYGFPRMGIAGAALASVAAEAISMLYLIAVTRMVKSFRIYRLYAFGNRILQNLREIFRVSVYLVLQHFFSMSAWFTFFLIIERMGEHDLAISNIVRNIYSFMMLPIWGVCSAAQTLTGNLIGEGRRQEVFTALGKSARLSLLITLCIAVPVAIFPVQVLTAFTNNPLLVNNSVNVLYIVMGALCCFSVAWIYYSGISGTGDTRIAMWIEIISLVLYLTGLYLISAVFMQPIEVAWCSEYIYFVFFGLFSAIYWYRWKRRLHSLPVL